MPYNREQFKPMTYPLTAREVRALAVAICERIEGAHWQAYKNGVTRGDPDEQGRSNGAAECARTIEREIPDA